MIECKLGEEEEGIDHLLTQKMLCRSLTKIPSSVRCFTDMLTRQHAVSTSGQQFPKLLHRKTKRNIKLLRTTGKRSLWAWHAAADRFIDAFLCWCCAILYIHTIHTLIQLHRLTHSALRIYSMQILIFPITLSSQLLLAGVASSYVSTLSCLSSIV